MHDVFISYSTKDISQAEMICNVLEQNNIVCWMAPRNIPGGSNYTKEIPIAIRESQVFVLVLSQSAQNSHWVLKELDSAVNNGKVILPVMLEDCALNDEFNFLLSGAQRYSAYQKKSEVLETLVSRVHALIKPRPANTTAAEFQGGESISHVISEPAPQVVVETAPGPAPQVVVETAPNPAPQVVVAVAPSPAPQMPIPAVCPNCGCGDIEQSPNKIGLFSGVEVLFLLLIPVYALAFMYYVFVLIMCAVLVGFTEPTIIGIVTIVGSIGSLVWGVKVAKELILCSRVKKNLSIYAHRCRQCYKKFLPSTKPQV